MSRLLAPYDVALALGALRRRRALLAHDRWARARLEAYQSRQLAALRHHACAHSPFYRRFHAGREGAPLHDLPVLTKATLMAQFDAVVTAPGVRLADLERHIATLTTDARFLGRYRVAATSGSSGRRGIFLFGRDEWADCLASAARAHDWTGQRLSLRHRRRIAFVASTTAWHFSARLGATLGAGWAPALRLDAGEPVADLVRALNAFRPGILVCFPSIAGILAGEQRAGRLRIAPALIFTGAEVLTEATRRRVEGAWGRCLFDQYAATEGGVLAAECDRHTGLHLFEDRVICEVVDRHYRPVPPGDWGERLLITVLGGHTLPLIRYELDDSVRLAAEPCPCGRPFRLLAGIQGKAQEILTLRDGAGDPVPVNPVVFHRLLDTVPVEGWQVVQRPDELRILVARPGEDFDEQALARGVAAARAAQGAAATPVRVERVATIPRGATGKAALVTAQVTGQAPVGSPGLSAPVMAPGGDDRSGGSP
jgi:putative adenylate-forming enzyme